MKNVLRTFVKVIAVTLAISLVHIGQANAGGIGKVVGRAAMNRMLAKEAARDAATPATVFRRGHFLSRYATRAEAGVEARQGLHAGQHLVGPSEGKSLLSAEAASARYGLQHKTPQVRELWFVPKGMPARINPVWGGARDATETTLTRPLQPRNLMRIEPLPGAR